jgi:hypothetical protein
MSDQFDGDQSRSERDIGIARVLSANSTWADDIGAWISNLPHGWKGTGEDIRRIWLRNGGLKPKHHNAWGGVISSAVRRGVLQKTGKRQNMKWTPSHSRTTDEYLRV